MTVAGSTDREGGASAPAQNTNRAYASGLGRACAGAIILASVHYSDTDSR